MLSERQKKYLRGLAHQRKPVVLLGKAGLTDSVAQELDSALAIHELVKVGARTGDREQRDGILAQLAAQTKSELIQRVGNMGLFYRPNPQKTKRLVLPD